MNYKDRDWLYNYYVEEEYSEREIAVMCKVSRSAIGYWRRKHNILARTQTEALKIKFAKFTQPTKNRKRSKEVRKKISEKLKKYYEIHDGSWKGLKHLEETKKKISDALKGNQNALGHVHTEESKYKMSLASENREPRFGVNSANWIDGRSLDLQYQRRWYLRRLGLSEAFMELVLHQKKKRTDIELMIEYWLLNNEIFYEFQRYINLPSTYTKIDFFIEPNICLYCDGNYYHELEKRKMADERITKELESLGYRIIRLWGSDIHDGVRPWEILRLSQLEYEQQFLE